ncbi:MAG: hypothetical protein VST70_07300 [Nitrospirota bacterium]|nr:hypothetical protein [Nitrospirota bacterium]
MSRVFCFRVFLIFFPLFLTISTSASSEELLDTEHPHYSQQLERVQKAIGTKEDKKAEDAALITDARRSMKWIFEEPNAAETEEARLNGRISKEFLDLNLPILIRPSPPRSILFEKFTPFSSLILDYSANQILVTVSVPYYQDSGMRKAKNEAVFLSILLLQDGIMDISVDGKKTVAQSVSRKITEPGGLMEQYISTNGLSPSGLSVDINKLAAGGGLATAHIHVPVPLHLGGALALEIAKKSHPPLPLNQLKEHSPPHPYTGLILDARHFDVKPFRDPILISDQSMSLFMPDAGRPSTSMPYGWAGWEDGLTPGSVRKRVGTHPLVVRPEQLADHHLFLLSKPDSRKVVESFQNTSLLSSGHIVILVRPERLPAVNTSSPANGHHR